MRVKVNGGHDLIDLAVGLVPTLSTSEYPPYLLARLVNTLDHVTEGRIGWNCVTSSNDGAAENYGHDGQRPHTLDQLATDV